MDLATIRGVVVATRKHAGLDGVRLLVAQLEDVDGKAVGEPIVVADALQAGVGQRVWVVHGREAALALPVAFTPVDHAVVALVDAVERT
jgi:ethanolamine utilization protein EutN